MADSKDPLARLTVFVTPEQYVFLAQLRAAQNAATVSEIIREIIEERRLRTAD